GLNGQSTLSDLFEAIHTQTQNHVTAALNARKTGIDLTDDTSGTALFAVTSANNSRAATVLGILGQDARKGETPDHKIEGGDIAGLTPADRFFLKDVNASVGLHLTSPAGLNLAAQFGFLKIDLAGSVNLDASLGLALKDPGTTAADGNISLTELFHSLSDISTLLDAPGLTGGGDVMLTVSVSPTIPGLTISPDPLVLHVNSWGNPFTGDAPDV